MRRGCQALRLGAALLVLGSAPFVSAGDDSARYPGLEANAVAYARAQRPEPAADAAVSPSSYDDYVGQYDYGGAILTLTRDGDRLMAQLSGQPKFEIFPKAEAEFFWKAVRAEVAFVRGAGGKVVKAVHRQGGTTLDAPRVGQPLP